MTLFQAALLGLIEGLTEFLPVSSTGHLILAQSFLRIPTTDFTKSFDILIQLAAILSVICFFRDQLLKSLKIWTSSLISFLPTGLIGFLFYKVIRDVLLESPEITAYSLFFGGLALLLVDRLKKLRTGQKNILTLKIKPLLLIGFFQSISIIPGVSRSAASIVGGLIAGLSRSQAVEFSFFLAIPTIFAATGYDLLKSGLHFTSSEGLLLLVGCLSSFLSASLAIKLFLGYVKKHDFTVFAIYRIVLAAIFLIFK